MKNTSEHYFRELYEQHWDTVFRICMGYVNDAAWAKDIVQETFTIAWTQLPNFRGDAKVSTWLYRITVNICLRQLQRSKKVVRNEEFIAGREEIDEEYQEEEVSKLYAAIATLSEVNRLIISMELEGVDQKEIAEITGLSHGNVRTRISRIKEEIYKKMK